MKRSSSSVFIPVSGSLPKSPSLFQGVGRGNGSNDERISSNPCPNELIQSIVSWGTSAYLSAFWSLPLSYIITRAKADNTNTSSTPAMDPNCFILIQEYYIFNCILGSTTKISYLKPISCSFTEEIHITILGYNRLTSHLKQFRCGFALECYCDSCM